MFQKKFSALVSLTFVLLQIKHALTAEFPAQIKESVHQVSIRVLPADDVLYGSGHKCSGVIISNFTVLTSASCLLKDRESGEFYDAKDLKVAMGSLDRLVQGITTFYTDVKVVKTHGRFNRRTYANNLAILELERVEFALTIIPVMMSSEKVVKDLDCYVLGWKSRSGELTQTLMQSNVRTNTCSDSKNLPFATFCSSETSPDLDRCVGEEGSGIVCNGLLRGIVSMDCGQGDEEFTQYTDVSQMYNWIWLSHLGESLKMIDNDMLKSFIYSTLDIIAYFVNTPKIADDFEMIKFIF